MSESFGASRSPRILVVEEDARKREQICQEFARRGYWVEAAAGEREALARVSRTPFDVALLSAHLPATAGRGSGRRGDGATGRKGGAGFLAPSSRRPLAPSDLPNRLRRLRPEMVTLVLNRRSYQRATMAPRDILHLTERLLCERLAMQRDRRLARCFQETLLPQPSLSLPQCEIACVYEPGGYRTEWGIVTTNRVRAELTEAGADGLGGDFYDLFTLPSGRLGILMGDVSGRGVEVASFTAMARYYARAYAHQRESPAYVLEQTNAALERDTPEERFVTLFFAALIPESREFTWASAGHEPPLLLEPGAASPVTLEPTGRALGMLPDATYGERVAHLLPGALLLLYTDGVTDPWVRNGAWDTTPLQRLLVAARDQPADNVAAAIVAAARTEAGHCLTDDLSLIVIRGT